MSEVTPTRNQVFVTQIARKTVSSGGYYDLLKEIQTRELGTA